MINELTKQDLGSLANQLSHPRGEAGLKIAEQMNRSNQSMTLASFDTLHLNTNDRVLEIGHGNAGHLVEVLSENSELSYTGLEISKTMQVEAIYKNLDFIFRDQVNFEHYSGGLFPLEDGSYDKIVTVNCIYFWSSIEKVFQEIKRVLKPGGFLVITFAEKIFMEKLPYVNNNFNLYEPEYVISVASLLGFKIQGVYNRQDQVLSKQGIIERPYCILKFTL